MAESRAAERYFRQIEKVIRVWAALGRANAQLVIFDGQQRRIAHEK